MAKVRVSFKQYDDVIHTMLRNGNNLETSVEMADEVLEIENSEF